MTKTPTSESETSRLQMDWQVERYGPDASRLEVLFFDLDNPETKDTSLLRITEARKVVSATAKHFAVEASLEGWAYVDYAQRDGLDIEQMELELDTLEMAINHGGH